MDAARIIAHMNDDHTNALVLFCRVFGGRAATVEARMVGIDRDGFDVLATDAAGGDPTAVRLAFDLPVESSDGARSAMVELVKKARAS